MALEAGSVYAVLGGKFMPSGFAQFDAAMKKSVASATAAEAQIGRSSGRSATAMTALGTAAKTGAAAGLLAVGVAAVSSVKSAQKFERQISELRAVTRASSQDMATMRKAALDLGSSTGIGATKAAQALTELAKGGLSSEKAIGALKGTIAMAQAGGMDLATAGETVANALNLFKLRGEDATMVADSFANAANATTADIGFFSQGMAQGGAAAKAAGLDFQQTTVFLEAMAANGFKSGSDAGTSMKTALIQLANPTKRAQEAAAKLGVTFFDSQGQIRPLPALARDLGAAFEGMSKREKLATATRLVGTDGMRALLALADQGPAKLNAFAAANAETGSAARVAADKMDNYEGATQRLSAAFESLKIEAGTALMPALTSAANTLATFFNQLRTGEGVGGAVAKVFGGLADGYQAFISLVTDSGNVWQNFSRIFGEGFTNAALGVLGAIRAIISAISFAAGVGGKFNPFSGFKSKADEALGNIDRITSELRNINQERTNVKIVADNKNAISSIQQIQRSKIAPKVAKILGQDTDAKSKIQALIRLGIPRKIATVLANTGSAQAAIAQLKAEMASVTSKTVTLTVRRVGSAISGNASGRGAGTAETALVGEGGGPEYVVNARTGRSVRVDGPTVMSLGAEDYVIPTESRYRGRALGLISQMAADMGLIGYERGRGARTARRPQLTPEEKKRLAEARRLKAFQSHSLEWYDSEIGKEEAKADNKKNGKLTAGAYKARRRLRELRAQRKLASDYKRQIDTATTEADIQTDRMGQAEKSGDRALFREASQERGRQLQRAIELLNAAIPKAKGTFKQSLRAQLERLKGEKVALDTDGTELPAASVLDGFDDPETQRIAELDAAIALAQIDTPLDFSDDETAIRAKLSFLDGVLSGARGSAGPQRISAIAGAIRQTRDELASLTGGPGLTPDQQAQNEQKMNRDRINAQSAFIDRLVGATIGGANQTLVFQSYVPPSPTEAKRLADYTVGGIGYQGATPSSKERIGV